MTTRFGSKKKEKKHEIEFPTNPLAQFDEDDDGEKQFYQPLSYKKLMETIITMHPVDPATKEKFPYADRITVKDYFSKLTDVMGCYQVRLFLLKITRLIRKKILEEDDGR